MKRNVMKIVLSLWYVSANAQCLTDQLNYEILKKEPELMKLHNQLYSNVPPVSSLKRTAKYIIPVVFHVMHTNGAENISKAQIQDQIRILNEDYSFTNPNKSNIRSIFTGVAANMQIEFRLATIDPVGNCTDGINRVYSSEHVNAYNNVKSVPLARWPNNKYLNIWVVSSINSSGSPGIVLGFAQFPSTSAGTTYNSTDGIVVRADYVGSIGTSNTDHAGRVLTHEIGHYLGLLHPFTDSCYGTGKDAGDRCEDTPPVAGTFTNANCNPNTNSCHTDTLNDLPDQFENYMDYSEGKCQAMFTLEQMAIVYNTFNLFDFRKNLVSQENLLATGVMQAPAAPLAGFNSSSRKVCVGKPVTFYDISCQYQIDSRSWAFNGADISASSNQNPTVKYSKPGFYSVTLTATNSNGSGSVTKTDYIEVVPGQGYSAAVQQTFENPNFEGDEGWRVVVDQGSSNKFKLTSAGSFAGQNSLVAPINSFVRSGTLYRLMSPSINVKAWSGLSPKLSFMCAYAKPNSTSSEVLRVLSSNDCGNTWTQRYTRQTTGLYSITGGAQNFVPSDQSQWKQHSIPLNFAGNDSNAMFIIEVQSDGGGPLYIDNINVSQFNTSTNAISVIRDMVIFPVPAKDNINISFTSFNSEPAIIEITNALGQVIETREVVLTDGEQTESIHFRDVLNNGIYFVNIKSEHQHFIGKLIIGR